MAHHSGFLLAGLNGLGRPGYLLIPYHIVGSVDVYDLPKALDGDAVFFPKDDLEFIDQPVRFVMRIPDHLLESGVSGVIDEVSFKRPRFITYDIRVVAIMDDGSQVVAGGTTAPSEMPGVQEGTILEVYASYHDVDHRPWSLRVARGRLAHHDGL